MNASGGLLSQNRYMPFGEVRGNISSSPITQTDFGYTGQRDIAAMGLMDYKARFYSPTLMRFTQPDTFIPNPGNPQSFNRYSYGLNNPVKYIDPDGHKAICIDEQCFDTTPGSHIHYSKSVAAPPIKDYGLFGPVVPPKIPKMPPKKPLECNPANPYACDLGRDNPEGFVADPLGDNPFSPTGYPPYFSDGYQPTWYISFDPPKVDWMDVGTGGVGLVGDYALPLCLTGIVPACVVYGVSEFVGTVSLTKNLFEWELLRDEKSGVDFIVDVADAGEVLGKYGKWFSIGDIIWEIGQGFEVIEIE